MRYINKQIFKFIIVTILLLIINPCYAMSDETLSIYNQIISKSNDLDKYIQDIKDSAKQIGKFEKEAEDITKGYKKSKQTDINKSINDFKELKIKEQNYINSLPMLQAKKEFDDVIILVKTFLPKLQQEKFVIDEDYTDYFITKELTTAGQTLQKAARYNEEIYSLELKLIQQQKLQQLEVRDLTTAQIDYLKSKIDSKKSEIAGIEAELTSLEKTISNNEQELEKAKNQMQQVQNDQNELKKYWWAIGYNLYLAGKNIDNEVNKKYENALTRAKQLNTELKNCKKNKSNLNVELSNLNKEIQKAQNDINECNNFLASYVQQINSTTQIMLKYSNMIVEIGQSINTFENNSNSVKTLLDVIESITDKEREN